MTKIKDIKKLVEVFEKYKRDQDRIQKKIVKIYNKMERFKKKLEIYKKKKQP